MRIDFIADVVCPWCWLGWIRLHKALALRPEVAAEVVWRTYQLRPDLPEEGVPRTPPTGDAAREQAATVALEAAADGVNLNYGAITRMPNTNAAHRLIRWAHGQGRQAQTVEALFAAYFTQGRDVGDPIVLSELAGAAGLDPMRVLDALSRDLDRDAVTAETASARREGVVSVPFIVFDGRLSVMGAQPPERLVRVIDTALRESA